MSEMSPQVLARMEAMAESIVIKPYLERHSLPLVWRVVLSIGLVMLATLYGLFTAVMPLSLLMIPAVPILALLGICLWLMPDIGGYYSETYEKLLTWSLVLHILWPGYVALNFPGLPWIGPMRVIVAMLVFTFLMNFATSAEMRRTAKESTMGEPFVGRMFWIYWGLTTVTLVLSNDIMSSVTKYANNQIFWTLMFVQATMLARRPGFLSRAMMLGFVAVLPTCIAAIFEYRMEKVIWIEFLPTWLWGDEVMVAELLNSSARAGTDGYRVRGTMLVPLYYSEYLAMMFPIGLFLLWKAEGGLRKLAMLLALALIAVAMFLTGSRTAMAGLLVASVAFVFFIAVQVRARQQASIMSMAVLVAYPVLVVFLGVLLLTWNRLRVMVLGGGQHQASDLAREVQWTNGLEILARNPFGHGASRNGDILGYANPAGELTIDTYYLSVMLDYGVLALPIFIAMFSVPIWLAWTASRRVWKDEEIEWIVPLGISLLNFIIIKSVLSTETNLPVAFAMLGFSVSLAARMRAEQAGLIELVADRSLVLRGGTPQRG